MGRYINLTVEAEVDLGDIEDEDLREELERRDKKTRRSDLYELGDLADLPIKNLDFRMKMELFIDIWEKYSFTDLKDRLK